MKKTLSTLLSVLFCAITFAQSVPQGINYQAAAAATAVLGLGLFDQLTIYPFKTIA